MSANTATCVVQLAEPSGVEINAHLVLEGKPTRQDQKLKTLSGYVGRYPSGWKKRLELANLLCETGRWLEAVSEYRQVIQRQPQLVEVRLQLGKILHLLGRGAEAIEVYQSASCLCGNAATGHHLRGLIEVCRGCPQQAAAMFESAASLEPDNPAHWHALGQVCLEAECPPAALRAFEAALSLNPDDVVALSQSYEPLLAAGSFREARLRLERALELAPSDCRTLERLATHRCHQGLVVGEGGKQTKQLIRTALQLAPDSASAHQVLSLYYLCRGEWEKGVAVLLKFTEEHPNSAAGWYYCARCLSHTGSNQAAAGAILQACALYKYDGEIYRALCEILPAAGRVGELQSRFSQAAGVTHDSTRAPLIEEMLAQFPSRWSVWASAGRVLVEHLGDIERGCAVSAKGPQLQPQLADAWFRHGRVLALAGRHRQAVETLECGWAHLPEAGGYLQSVPAAVWLGDSYRDLGERAQSRYWWGEACSRALGLLEFNPATAYYWQGRALSALGDAAGAAGAYRSALSGQLLYPARAEVKEALKGF